MFTIFWKTNLSWLVMYETKTEAGKEIAKLIEKESTNLGDNFRFSKQLLKNYSKNIKSCIVVCKPYDEKRVYASFKKIMPEYELIIASENISCEDYYKKNGTEWINVLVGDIQRMKLFYEKGWQIYMNIPKEVWEAYEILVKKGYDKFVFKNGVIAPF